MPHCWNGGWKKVREGEKNIVRLRVSTRSLQWKERLRISIYRTSRRLSSVFERNLAERTYYWHHSDYITLYILIAEDRVPDTGRGLSAFFVILTMETGIHGLWNPMCIHSRSIWHTFYRSKNLKEEKEIFVNHVVIINYYISSKSNKWEKYRWSVRFNLILYYLNTQFLLYYIIIIFFIIVGYFFVILTMETRILLCIHSRSIWHTFYRSKNLKEEKKEIFVNHVSLLLLLLYFIITILLLLYYIITIFRVE